MGPRRIRSAPLIELSRSDARTSTGPWPPELTTVAPDIEAPLNNLHIAHYSDPPHDHYDTVKGLGGVLGFLVSIWGPVLNPMGESPFLKKNRQPG